MFTKKLRFFNKNVYTHTINIKRTKSHRSYSLVEPAEISPLKTVPSHIVKPNYYETGATSHRQCSVELKNQNQIDGMIKSCQLASSILKKVTEYVQIGVTTDDIDNFVHNQCIKNNAYPSPLRYRGFPKSVCTSVNNVAVHGIPDSRPLENGDIINVDITVFYDGYHGDCSKTFLIGDVDDQGKELVAITEECLAKGISICGPGTPFKEIGATIQKFASRYGFTVVPSLIGHGIGSYFHGPPDIYHMRNTYPGVMKPGMTFTIEPVITSGEELVEILEDGWTVVMADNSRAAQAEHTILIEDNGFAILTNQH